MYILYSLALTLGVIVLLPRFAWDAVRHGKYVEGLSQRLGNIPSFTETLQKVVWVHCVSVGETLAARPLIEAIRLQYPSHSIIISTTTATGQEVARKMFGDLCAAVIYFPFDWRWCVRRALKRTRPSAVLITETEIWPNFLRECESASIPVAIVNGRLSATSFRRYGWIKAFIGKVLKGVRFAIMQTESDAERISELGLKSSRIKVSGNIKFDLGSDAAIDELANKLKSRFEFDGSRPLLVAASTHSPEEQILLDVFRRIKADRNGTAPRLLIAPRHPERFSETASVIDGSGFTWARRSDQPLSSDKTAEIILLDTIGELRSTYALADVVFVGGSVANHGGHNLLEPAAAGACIITGPHTENFAEIVSIMLKSGAVIQLGDGPPPESIASLLASIEELMDDTEKRRVMGQSALKVVEQNRGATRRTMEFLEPLFTGTPGTKELYRSQKDQTGEEH
jgi:3-deoxy-D-manno-octulosonic-acid transferase